MLKLIDRERAPTVRLLWNWSLCWLILPNLGFMLLSLVGTPPRYPEILAGGAVGLLVRRAGLRVKLGAFVLVLTYNSLSLVSALFNLSIWSLVASLEFLVEMRPETSPEYALCAVFVLLTLVAATRVLRLPTGFDGTGALAGALALIVTITALDAWMSFGTRGSYKRSAPNGAPFDSAVGRSGFAADADGGRHLILVMVESMGEPADPVARARLMRRWTRADIRERYEVTTGKTAFFGSTTNGEVRALCGRWGDYNELLPAADVRCLPARLRQRGYRTTALHSFDGSFFDRKDWYPNVGFDRQMFRDELFAQGAGGCPGVFPGACDRDVPAIISRQLKGASQPQFVYWLTVNSHLPVPTSDELRTTRCAPDQPIEVRRFAMICRQFTLWDEIQDQLAAEMVRPDFPDADVLIVGDHMPPYFDRAQRSEFDPAHVPWTFLRRRASPAADARQAALTIAQDG